MSFRSVLLAAAAVVLSAASPAFAAFTVDFAPLIGDSSPLDVPMADGNVVTFDSSSGPGTFTVGSTAGLFSFGAGLGDFASFSGDTLTISFADPVEAALSFAFGIEDAFGSFGDDFLTITSNTGVSVVANTTPNGLLLSEPEGTAYIDAPGATLFTITGGIPSNSSPFAIANVTVPEPVTLSLLSVGLAGLAAARSRRKA